MYGRTEMWNRRELSELLGKTLKSVIRGEGSCHGDEIRFETYDGDLYRMVHHNDCCESVTIEDICGELDHLVGDPILKAEESTNSDSHPDGTPKDTNDYDSFTWTFYHLATIKGYATIRWFGVSNGYYSESVDFEKLERD